MANGIYTNTELVDTIIVDLNNLPARLIAGQFIQACALVAQIGQRLVNLREGIKTDLDGKDRVIEDLKNQLRTLGATVEEITPEEYLQSMTGKDGAENGGN